jgi:hypothetical protein
VSCSLQRKLLARRQPSLQQTLIEPRCRAARLFNSANDNNQALRQSQTSPPITINDWRSPRLPLAAAGIQHTCAHPGGTRGGRHLAGARRRRTNGCM